MTLKAFTIADIRSWNPCYDPAKHLASDWSGTALDILKHGAIPPLDKLWVVCREGIIDDRTLRLFAVWCARQVEHLLPDDRSQNATNVAERFANGDVSKEDLAAASAAAWAASAAASDAAWAAAWAASAAARAAQMKKLIEMLEES